MVGDGPEPAVITLLFDITNLGEGLYFLSLMYLIVSISSSFKLKRINNLPSAQRNSHKTVHRFLAFFLWVRTLTFSVLCVIAIMNQTSTTSSDKPYYPLLVAMFTLPEFLIISSYMLLYFHWLEIYVFSHQQFMFLDKAKFRNKWSWLYFIVSLILYIGLFSSYAALFSEAALEYNTDQLTRVIVWIETIANYVIAGFAILIGMYFSLFVLSGFGVVSAVAGSRLKRVHKLMLVWTLARLLRASMLYYSLNSQNEVTWNKIYKDMLMVSELILSELLPIWWLLDWTNISVWLLGTEAEPLLRANSPGVFAGGEPRESQLNISSSTAWELDFAELDLESEAIVDQGTYFIKRGRWGNKHVLAKGYRVDGATADVSEELKADIVDFSALEHAHIVPFIGVTATPNIIFVIYEPMASSLPRLLSTAQRLTTREAIKIIYQIAQGLEYLHYLGQAHLQLHPNAIDIDFEGSVRLCDVGTHRVLQYARGQLAVDQTSSSLFDAPEQLHGQTAGKPADVFAFGLIMWCVVSGEKRPWPGKAKTAVQAAIASGQRPEVPADAPEKVAALIGQCCATDAAKRPTMVRVVSTLEAVLAAQGDDDEQQSE